MVFSDPVAFFEVDCMLKLNRMTLKTIGLLVSMHCMHDYGKVILQYLALLLWVKSFCDTMFSDLRGQAWEYVPVLNGPVVEQVALVCRRTYSEKSHTVVVTLKWDRKVSF